MAGSPKQSVFCRRRRRSVEPPAAPGRRRAGLRRSAARTWSRLFPGGQSVGCRRTQRVCRAAGATQVGADRSRRAAPSAPRMPSGAIVSRDGRVAESTPPRSLAARGASESVTAPEIASGADPHGDACRRPRSQRLASPRGVRRLTCRRSRSPGPRRNRRSTSRSWNPHPAKEPGSQAVPVRQAQQKPPQHTPSCPQARRDPQQPSQNRSRSHCMCGTKGRQARSSPLGRQRLIAVPHSRPWQTSAVSGMQHSPPTHTPSGGQWWSCRRASGHPPVAGSQTGVGKEQTTGV